MGFIILASLITMVVGLFFGTGLLVLVTKLFKIENPNYKKSLIVLIVSGIASFIAGIIFSIINLGFLSNVLVSITAFFVFHYFYKKILPSFLEKIFRNLCSIWHNWLCCFPICRYSYSSLYYFSFCH